MLPPSIQVCPVEIPGRGRREGDPGISQVSDLAAALAKHLPLQVTHILLVLYLTDLQRCSSTAE